MTKTKLWVFKTKHILPLLLFYSFFLVYQLTAQELPLTHFTTDKEIKPLPSAAITGVFQDQTGYMWIAAYSTGLVRYDGTNMQLFNAKQGLNYYIFSITQDKQGRLWVGTALNGMYVSTLPLAAYAPSDTISFTNKLDSIPLPTSQFTNQAQVLADSYGNIWTSIPDKILRYSYNDQEKLQVDTIALPEFPAGKHATFSFTERASGNICAIGNTHHLFHLSPSQGLISHDTLQFDEAPTGKSQQVNFLMEASDQTLWANCGNGYVWSLEEKDNFKPKVHNRFAGKRVQMLRETKEGHMLAATIGAGLLEWQGIDTKNAVAYTARHGLLSNVIWDIAQDTEGNVWLATNASLSRMPRDYKAFGHYTANSVEGAPNMLPEAGVNAVLVDYQWKDAQKDSIERMIVAGTSSGISIIRKDDTREIMTSKEGLLSDLALGLHQDPEGRLWVLSRKGFSCISRNADLLNIKGMTTPTVHQLWGQSVYVNTLAFTHTIQAKTIRIPKSKTDTTRVPSTWFICADRVVILLKDQWYVIHKEAGLTAKGLRSIAVDDQQYIYLGGANTGLWKSQFPMSVANIQKLESAYDTIPRFKEFKKIKSTFFERSPIVVKKDTLTEVVGLFWWDSLLWAGTNKGILAVERNTATPVVLFNQKDGLEKNSANSFVVNKDASMIWAASGHGLYGIDLSTKKIVKKVKKKDGLVSSTGWAFPSIIRNKEGLIYFATNKGLSVYDPILDQSDTLAPAVGFQQFQFQEKSNGNNELVVAFSALSYTNESGIRYKTRLKGYDKNWSEAGAKTSIRYTNLPASVSSKEYAFEVMAGDEAGNWTKKPFLQSFQVAPPWYLHWLSMIFYGLTGLFSIAGYTKWRTNLLEKRQVALEKVVTERTAEVVAEKERSDELLLNILPAETAQELKESGFAKAKNYDLVSIIFTDFKGFTQHSERLSPEQLIAEIDHCFKAFDRIMGQHNVEKIKTVGDAYLAAAGLPTRNSSHPIDAVKAALALRDFMKAYQKERTQQNRIPFEMRIGIHTGPVVAGIVGIKKFSYDIWGDTVNLASRMESSGAIGKVNISQHTYELVKNHPDFVFTSRGKIQAKNKGEIDMFFIDWKANTP